MTPLCMTSDELALWQQANDAIPDRTRRADAPCRDCPLVFAEAMRSEGRCNGTPSGQGRARIEAPDYRIARLRRQWREAQVRKRAKVAA